MGRKTKRQKDIKINIARIAKAALHKLPGKSSSNVSLVVLSYHLSFLSLLSVLSRRSCFSCLSCLSRLSSVHQDDPGDHDDHGYHDEHLGQPDHFAMMTIWTIMTMMTISTILTTGTSEIWSPTWILHLVSIKNVIVKSFYNWLKLDILSIRAQPSMAKSQYVSRFFYPSLK